TLRPVVDQLHAGQARGREGPLKVSQFLVRHMDLEWADGGFGHGRHAVLLLQISTLLTYPAHPLGSVVAGSCCGQAWWSTLMPTPVAAAAPERTGRCPAIVVPWLGADRISSRPPSAASRSAMFRSPEPMAVWRLS